MKNIKIIIVLTVLLVCSFSYAGDYVIIVNPGNSTASISKAELKRLFKGKVKQLGGAKAVPINQVYTKPIAASFLDEAVGMDVNKYKDYWVKQQIKGKGTQPMVQKSSAAVKLIVAEIPGAIGYVESSAVDNTVKVVTVN